MLRCDGLPKSRLWLVLFFFAIPAGVLCQIQNGQFTGVIEDPTGANVPNARVLIKNVQTGYELVLHSNGTGSRGHGTRSFRRSEVPA
jgi:hypothetical protein